ncbi:hypothetical protein D3C80_1389030 [compost metagenome]
MHVGLAQQDGPGIAQLLQGRRVLSWDEPGQRQCSGGAGQAGGVDVVLDHDGDAGKRLQRPSGTPRGIGGPGLGQCAIAVQGDEGIQLAAFLGAVQAGADQLGAGQDAIAESGLRLGDGQIGSDREGLEEFHAMAPFSG